MTNPQEPREQGPSSEQIEDLTDPTIVASDAVQVKGGVQMSMQRENQLKTDWIVSAAVTPKVPG